MKSGKESQENVVDRVKMKLCDSKKRWGSLSGNKNAKKQKRRVDIGWLHIDDENNLKQVKGKKGGGTRSVTVDVCTTISDLLDQAVALFFPAGKSSMGTVDEFSFTMRKFDQTEVDSTTSVKDLYESTAFRLLHLYLCSKTVNIPAKKVKLDASLENINTEGNKEINIGPSVTDEVFLNTPAKKVKLDASLENINTEGNNEINKEPTVTDQVFLNTPAKKVNLDVSLENINTEGNKEINKEPTVTDQALFAENNGSDILAKALLEAELTYLSGGLDEPVISNFDDEVLLSSTTLETTYGNNETLKSSSFEIKVHRGHVLKELIQFFVGKDTASLRGAVVHVTMILPNGKEEVGEDNGGVMRDMLSEFWQTFYDNLCDGNAIKVPSLSPRMDNTKWKAVGCIISMGYYFEKYWPVELSPSFLKLALSGIETEKGDLLQEYLSYLPDSESDLLSRALHNFEDVEIEELVEFFDDHGHVSMPSPDNIRTLVCDVAHKEMIQSPAYVAECWRDELQMIQPMMTTPVYDTKSFLPTFKNVWPKISFQADTNKCAQSMLKRYIKELDKALMKKFLRFCTGN